MKLFSKLIIFMIFCLNLRPAFSQAEGEVEKSIEYKAILHIGGTGDFTQAKPVPFEFHFYPVGEKTINEVSSLVNIGRFLENFFVFEIFEKNFSPNNQDVFVVKGQLVMAELPRKNQLFSLRFQKEAVQVEIRSSEPKELKMEGKEVIFAKLPFLYGMSWFEKLIYCLLAILLAFSFFWGTKKLVIFFKRKRERKIIYQRILESFTKAETRDDYERIYRERENWISFLGGKNTEASSFIEIIEDVQYKRIWTDDETLSVKKKSEELLKTIKS